MYAGVPLAGTAVIRRHFRLWFLNYDRSHQASDSNNLRETASFNSAAEVAPVVFGNSVSSSLNTRVGLYVCLLHSIKAQSPSLLRGLVSVTLCNLLVSASATFVIPVRRYITLNSLRRILSECFVNVIRCN